jgi:hypothetical protein
MEKTAQKRSLLSRLREKIDIGGIAAEKFFHPEFQELMDRLRNDTDDPIRSIVSGEKIGEADPPPDGMSLKDLLKSARSNLNRREYMKAIVDLSRFHKKMEDIIGILGSFRSNIDAIHEKFLFQDLDEESKQHLHEMRSRLAVSKPEMVKEAGLLDLLTNLATERGRALAAWEKRYPKQVGKLKKDAENLYKRSEGLLTTVLSALKEMATHRATRKVDNYILSGEKIAKAYRTYDAEFRKFYADNVKGFLEKQELVAPSKPVEKPQEIGQQEVAVEPTSTIRQPPIPSAFVPPAPPAPKSVMVEHLRRPLMPGEKRPPSPEDTLEEFEPPTIKAPPPVMTPLPASPASVEEMYQQIQQPGALPGLRAPLPAEAIKEMTQQAPTKKPGKRGHQDFMASLETMASEHPTLLASFIGKYAYSIQESDPTIASKLLQLVQCIRNE